MQIIVTFCIVGAIVLAIGGWLFLTGKRRMERWRKILVSVLSAPLLIGIFCTIALVLIGGIPGGKEAPALWWVIIAWGAGLGLFMSSVTSLLAGIFMIFAPDPDVIIYD